MTDRHGGTAAQDRSLANFTRLAFGGAIASIIMGLVLLIWPGHTLSLVAALIGVWLCLVGIVRLVEASMTRGSTRNTRVLTAAVGLLYLVIGIICLRNLLGSIALLASVIGIMWVIGGVIEMIAAFSRGSGWGKVGGLILGLASMIVGFVLLVWPQQSLTVIVWVVGLWLLAIGVIQLVLAFTAHRAGRTGRLPPGTSTPAIP
jgi:uncharacterized membrane protein HdeD (DUF308 family)